MTNFVYIADTHLGANPMGYQQQKGYPENLAEILAPLRHYISEKEDVDFVLHGGDMVDSTTDANIVSATKAFDLPIPVYLCLGNHDLTEPDALDRWTALAPCFFISDSPTYTIKTDECMIHVVPNHWSDIPYYWYNRQNVHFSAEQMKYLNTELAAERDVPHVILTHSPIFGLPTEQTGFSASFHAPEASFSDSFVSHTEQYPNLQCVLGAHNHMNMRVQKGNVEYVTVSSLVEVPFEFKYFSVTPELIQMSTLSLQTSLSFQSEYDHSRSFVQGRATDRFLSTAISSKGNKN